MSRSHVPRPVLERYFALESFDVTAELVELCGASLDVRALSLLKRRLDEEQARLPVLEARGYTRMHEKCEQLVMTLNAIVTALEETIDEA